MTGPVARVVGSCLDWQAQCSCGWRGPNQITRTRAVENRDRHRSEGVHRGVFAGEWFQQQQWGPISNIRAEGRTLVFDPVDVIWPKGGQRIRIEDFDTDFPILAIEGFDRNIRRFQLVADAHVSAVRV